MIYKNTSYIRKTFYGVSFEPGETKEVPGHINDCKMIKVDTLNKEPPEISKPKTTYVKKDTKPTKTKNCDLKKSNIEEEKLITDDK